MTRIKGLVARFPYIEVLYRQLYWRIPFVAKFISKRRKGTVHPTQYASEPVLDHLIQSLRDMGITKGDVVIVHSKTARLAKAGHSMQDILNSFLDLVGPEGTIVMPAIPLLDGEPTAENRFQDALYTTPLLYKPKDHQIWTGRLPAAMIEDKRSYVSPTPLNAVVALGAQAKTIVESQPLTTGITACGTDSAWAKCYNLNAKIVMIDVDIAHSLTMIHAAEDLFENEWPIQNWYRLRPYRIVRKGHKEQSIEMRERHPKWALFYCENRFNRDLKTENIFSCQTTDKNLTLAVGTSRKLVDFLRSKRPSTYPYYIPFFVGKRRS